MALVLFVVILYFVPFVGGKRKMYTTKRTTSQLLFWGWRVNFLFLTWVGACPVEAPFILLSRVGCLLYFGYFFLIYAVECKDYSSPRGL